MTNNENDLKNNNTPNFDYVEDTTDNDKNIPISYLGDDKIDEKLKDQKLKNIEKDRELKEKTFKFIKKIIKLNTQWTFALISLNFVFKLLHKEIYSEKFMGFLLGSQAIVMPFVLLHIVTKHLFPTDKE